MARWAIPGIEFQVVWVHPETFKTTYESAPYLKIGGKKSTVIHVLLTHDSVPVGAYLETAPGLGTDQMNYLGAEAVGNYLKSRQRIEFIRLARQFPGGTVDDGIEPHMVHGLSDWEAVGSKPARRGDSEPGGLLQPGAFREPPGTDFHALRGEGLLVAGSEADEIMERLGGEDSEGLERLGGDEAWDPLPTVDEVAGELLTLAQLEAEAAADTARSVEADRVSLQAQAIERLEALTAPERLCNCQNKPPGSMCNCDEIARLAAINAQDGVYDFNALRKQRTLEEARDADDGGLSLEPFKRPRFDTVSAPISEMAQREALEPKT